MEAFLVPSSLSILVGGASRKIPARTARARNAVCCKAEAPRGQVWERVSRGLLACSLATAVAFGQGFPGIVNGEYSNAALAAAKGGGGTFKSASGRVNKDPESLLRWGLPVTNPQIRKLQSDLEDITYDIRGSKWSNVEKSVKNAQATLKKSSDSILASVAADKKEEASETLASIQTRVDELAAKVKLKASDEVVALQRDILRSVGQIELEMISEFPYKVPEEYKDLPQLKGRAVVEMKVKKAGDEKFDIDGTLYESGKMTMVVDGYSAPVTAGNFVDLVRKKFYNKMEINRSDGFVVQTGDPAGEAEGYIDPRTEKIRKIPLELFPQSDKAPLYGVTLEDEGRATEQTRLPFTSYGTLAMAREEFNPNSGSSQFFWFLFEPDLTPAGRNLLDGRYAVFGYVTDGEFFLRDLKAGDLITEAKVVSGLENLSAPPDVLEYKGAALERG